MEWINENNGMVMSVLTLVYVAATILILSANLKSVKEMKKSREEENRPYVIVYFESKTTGPTNLIVKNIGKTIAKDTRIQIEPGLDYPKTKPISQSNLLNKPIPDIPPNYEYKAFVGMSWDLKNGDKGYPVYKAKVTYKGYDNNLLYDENYIMDLNFQSGLLFLAEKEINDLAKDFSDFKKESKKQLSSISSSLKKISENRED